MKRYFLFALVLIGAMACSKDDDDPQPSKTDLLTASTWKFDEAGIDGDGNGTIDTPIPAAYALEDCEMDNTFTFRSDGTGTVDEGATKCDPANPQASDFTWSFTSSAQTSMTLSESVITGVTGDVDIKSITQTELVLSKEVNVGLPINVIVIVKFKH